jgi:hypothetical protein
MTPEMIKKELKEIAYKDNDFTLNIDNWFTKIQSELRNNSIKKVAEINQIPISLVEAIQSIGGETYENH